MKKLSLALAFLISLIAVPVLGAGITNLWTTNNGGLNFPITPNSIDSMVVGGGTPAAGTFTTLRFNTSLVSGGGLPTIVASDCGTGANGAVVAGSTNQSGSITIGATATTTCKITFSAALAAAPKACSITPMNTAAATTATTLARVGAPTTTDFTITGSALASANYNFICL